MPPTLLRSARPLGRCNRQPQFFDSRGRSRWSLAVACQIAQPGRATSQIMTCSDNQTEQSDQQQPSRQAKRHRKKPYQKTRPPNIDLLTTGCSRSPANNLITATPVLSCKPGQLKEDCGQKRQTTHNSQPSQPHVPHPIRAGPTTNRNLHTCLSGHTTRTICLKFSPPTRAAASWLLSRVLELVLGVGSRLG